MSKDLKRECNHQRVIIHVDFDCYYAQVEMMKNPQLRNKPLGVRQKTIVVTCNYLARDRGVKKLMSLKEAQHICPELVIVPGEDLSDYRDISYKVSKHLHTKFPLVEKLGFDENFIDATEEVEKRLLEDDSDSPHAVGNIVKYVNIGSSDELEVECLGDCHKRLVIGSMIAQEIRDSILSTFQLTCCAGIAHNKLLAKIVCAAHKPNQQSLLYPEDALRYLNLLSSVAKIQGIGPSMCKKLAFHSIETISQLQNWSLTDLDSILGKGLGITVQNLARGIDNSPVVPFRKPQSLSLEDSFGKGLTFHDCECKIRKMAQKLMERATEDGRIPHTVRLVLRQKFGSRESRQCPLPLEVFSSAKSSFEKGYEALNSLLLSLFTKMIEKSNSCDLTLLGITFANLQEPEKTSIHKFWKRPSCSGETRPPENSKRKHQPDDRLPNNIDPKVFEELPDELKQELLQEWHSDVKRTKTTMPRPDGIPHNIDYVMFKELPDSIQKELQQQWEKQDSKRNKSKTNTIMNYFSK